MVRERNSRMAVLLPVASHLNDGNACICPGSARALDLESVDDSWHRQSRSSIPEATTERAKAVKTAMQHH